MLHRSATDNKIPNHIAHELATKMHHFTIQKVSWSENLILEIRQTWIRTWQDIWLGILMSTDTESPLTALEANPTPTPMISNVIWKQWIALEVVRTRHSRQKTLARLQEFNSVGLEELCVESRRNLNE
jgi:hypothetical protein